ncbi:hypothetical protein FQN54_000054 [Arachnomyces sp. PD_36]|nr:hypothetical protein FQN54_000054 [Arachnomyces sp. PD_36]
MISTLFLPAVLFLLYTVISSIWAIYLHPLRHIPGPKLWIAFPIVRLIALSRGTLDINLRSFHAKYGDAVRFSPSSVSFITAQAWKDIYGHGHKQLPKWRGSSSNPQDIISSNDADHARYRKSLAHAFSARGLQAQEPVLIGYVDKLIAKLRGAAESQLAVDLGKWYNLTTFDVIGDLAFGESFGGLESNRYHHWVSTIFQFIRVAAMARLKDAYPLTFKALSIFMPKRLVEARKRQLEHSRVTVQKRLHSETHRGEGDFMESMLRHRGEKDGLTDDELVGNASILIIAGSETTATLLSGLTFWLLKTPEALNRVTHEVRSAMQSEDDITFTNVSANLPYMMACIKEGFRMYPPVPSGLTRVTPSIPMDISGYKIAPNTQVSVHQSAAYISPRNFHEPTRFVPERWLPEAKDDPSSPFYNDNRDVLQPFSMGPRSCIGMNLAYSEMRLILARMLWNFDLELCEESEKWNEQLSYIVWDRRPLMSQKN